MKEISFPVDDDMEKVFYSMSDTSKEKLQEMICFFIYNSQFITNGEFVRYLDRIIGIAGTSELQIRKTEEIINE